MRSEVEGVGIEFDVEGPAAGRPLLLLHGFPDSARVWRHQLPVLVDAGFRVITPDMRGYGRSDKPADIEAYNLILLAADVLAVLDSLGIDRAHVAAHDWSAGRMGPRLVRPRPRRPPGADVGGPPHRLPRGGPHPAAALVVHAPVPVPRGGRAVAQRRRLGELPGVEPAPRRRRRHRRPRARRGPRLSWYRANMPPEAWTRPPPQLPPVQAPTMGVWSTGDEFLTEEQMTGSAPHCANGFRYERLEGAGHWLQLDAPDQLSALLLDFLPC